MVFVGRLCGMSVPICLFFQGLEGLTEVFGRMSARMSGPRLPLWADFSFVEFIGGPIQARCLKTICPHCPRASDHFSTPYPTLNATVCLTRVNCLRCCKETGELRVLGPFSLASCSEQHGNPLQNVSLSSGQATQKPDPEAGRGIGQGP